MNLNDLSTQLLFTTLPIWTEDASGATAAATAFIYNAPVPTQEGQSIPLLVTNHHVVVGAQRAVVELIEREGDGPARDKRIRVELDPQALTQRANDALDVAVVPLGPVLNQLEAEGKPSFFRSVTPELIPSEEALAELAAMEDVVFIGYPSGLRDDQQGTPLIRRGITATPVWNDFQGRPSFLIDAGVFPGSSGSPVFILNQGAYSTTGSLVVGSRLLFLGIVTDTFLDSSGGQRTFLGLGRVTRSTALKSYLDEVVGGLLPQPQQ